MASEAHPERSGDTVPLSEGAARGLASAGPPDPRASLVFFHRGGATVVSLEPGVSVVVGREPPADVIIHDPSLSRRHARFTWADGAVVVEDLGSTNGTRTREGAIERATLAAGDVVSMGAVSVALYDPRPSALGLRGIAGHDAFRAWVDDEIVRAKQFGRSFSIVMVNSESGPAASFYATVLKALRPVDRIALYAPDCVEVLLPEQGPEAALIVARRIVAEERLRCAVASFPRSAGSVEELVDVCRSALRAAGSDRRVVEASGDGSRRLGPSSGSDDPGGPVLESAAMQAIFRTVDRLAKSTIPALLVGETGTGKEVVARAIHERGPRADKPLLCVNCGAIPAQLVESTLFGHERGAFTGATGQHRGVFEAADGGTVLLDEIGELPPPAQAALLRVLETKRVVRVGSTREIEVDVRVLAATHRDLDAMSEEGEFRTDLLFRLNAMTLVLPPLRNRTEDIPALVARFLERANAANGREVRGIEPEALHLLERYAWPGNIRELRNVIERAVVVADADVITALDLPDRVRDPSAIVFGRMASSASDAAVAASASAPSAPPAAAGPGDMKSQLARFEAEIILAALKRANWNQSEAARELRIPLRTLVHKIKAHGIKKLGYGLG